jgi:hypothetical protein
MQQERGSSAFVDVEDTRSMQNMLSMGDDLWDSSDSWHNATLPYSNFHSSVALAESDSLQTPTDSPVVS